MYTLEGISSTANFIKTGTPIFLYVTCCFQRQPFRFLVLVCDLALTNLNPILGRIHQMTVQ